jgi:hypothetical protein
MLAIFLALHTPSSGRSNKMLAERQPSFPGLPNLVPTPVLTESETGPSPVCIVSAVTSRVERRD